MATAIKQNVTVVKANLPPDQMTFAAGNTYIFPPVVVCDPPVPIDSKGSRSNAELREIAKNRIPPQSWFEGDEEQVF
jgi:hypothetical protein